VQRVLVRSSHEPTHEQQAARSVERTGQVTFGAACALAFLAALPQLCSP
jgi:hypothetical protein